MVNLFPDRIEDYSPLGLENELEDDVSLKGRTEEWVLRQIARFQSRLSARKLADMNLEEELVSQFRLTQYLQASVLAESDSQTPANQKAQVANATSASLKTLIDLQESVHNSELVKRLSRATVKTINTLSDEAQKAFMAELEKNLERS